MQIGLITDTVKKASASVFQPCTETLFLSLFKEYRMTLSGVVLKMVHEIQGPCDMDNMVAILRKDAGKPDADKSPECGGQRLSVKS